MLRKARLKLGSSYSKTLPFGRRLASICCSGFWFPMTPPTVVSWETASQRLKHLLLALSIRSVSRRCIGGCLLIIILLPDLVGPRAARTERNTYAGLLEQSIPENEAMHDYAAENHNNDIYIFCAPRLPRPGQKDKGRLRLSFPPPWRGV